MCLVCVAQVQALVPCGNATIQGHVFSSPISISELKKFHCLGAVKLHIYICEGSALQKEKKNTMGGGNGVVVDLVGTMQDL